MRGMAQYLLDPEEGLTERSATVGRNQETSTREIAEEVWGILSISPPENHVIPAKAGIDCTDNGSPLLRGRRH